MADILPVEIRAAPDFWEQWRTILWLRWRLTRNQWARRGMADEAAGFLLRLLITLGVVLACGIGFLLGSRLLDTAPPGALLLACDGLVLFFLFSWLIGLLTEIQRSESLDISKLLHLPISLGHVFAFNYASSWITPSILIALPGLVSLSLGLAVSRGPQMLLMIPVILGFFFVTTAATYLLRGWLVSLMANERRRRTIVVVASVLAVSLIQLPNLYFNVMRQQPGLSGDDSPAWISAAHTVLPPLWVGASAESLSQRNVLPSASATAGGLVLGGLALFVGYRGTLRAHHGIYRVPKPRKARAVPPSRMVAVQLPLVSGEAAAVALATLQSHLRAPEVKMALFGQVVMNLAFAFIFLRPGAAPIADFQPGLGALIAMLSLFGSIQILFNQFGFDRDGFRAYVLAPVSRKNLLIGKNLAAFPLVSAMGILVLLAALVFGLIGPLVLLAALLTLFAGFVLFSVLGNWISIVAPYRMAAGSLKPTKVPPRVTLLILAGMLLSPVAGAVMFIPAMLEFAGRWLKWPAALPVNLAGSALLVGCAAGLYALTLGPLARLLARREKNILAEVTREIE